MLPPNSSQDHGKGKGEGSWTPEWWQFCSLNEMQSRPIVWTNHSTILFAHPTQPFLCGRIFPSSRQFILAPPQTPVVSMCEPATILAVSPDERYLFAYFPAKEGHGISCIWSRVQSDEWSVKECRNSSEYVAASWLGASRARVPNKSGASTRLPVLGPRAPRTRAALVLVSQDMKAEVWYLPDNSRDFKMLSCSLRYPDEASEDNERPISTYEHGLDGVRVCTTAAVGFTYTDSSIIIAMRSALLPGALPDTSLALQISMDLSEPFSKPELPGTSDWDYWGNSLSIDIVELRFGFENNGYYLATGAPLSPLKCPADGCKLTFIPAEIQADRSADPRIPDHKLYLVVTSILQEDVLSLPKTQLTTYASKYPKSGAQAWNFSLMSSRTFDDEVITFVSPHHNISGASTLVVGTVQTRTVLPRRKHKGAEIALGSIYVLNASSLTARDGWPRAPLLAPPDYLRRELKFDIALSPSGSLACYITELSTHSPSVVVMSLPRATSSVHTDFSEYTPLVCAAMLSGASVTDLTHQLSTSSSTLSQAEHALEDIFKHLERYEAELRDVWLPEFLGLAVEIYRMRWNREEDPAIKSDLGERWQAARDMCAIISANKAFLFCSERENDDVEAVWYLVQLSSWILSFTENLMRECVFIADEDGPKDNDTGAASGRSSHFLHILHPHALEHLRTALAEVKKLYEHLAKYNTVGANAQIAKKVLVDAVQGSGVKLEAFDALLLSVEAGLKDADAVHLTQSLANCRPHPAMGERFRAAIENIIQSGALDKPALFINPAELISGFTKLNMTNKSGTDNPRDIVTKGALIANIPMLVCLRCGGKTQLPVNSLEKHPSKGWMAWKKLWATQCICGGFWSSGGLGTSLGSLIPLTVA